MHIRNMLTGYARVSTDDQDLRLQRGLLTKVGCRRIFARAPLAAEKTGSRLWIFWLSSRFGQLTCLGTWQ